MQLARVTAKSVSAQAAVKGNPADALAALFNETSATEAAFPRLPFVWLATPSSEDSVFLLRREDLLAAQRAAA